MKKQLCKFLKTSKWEMELKIIDMKSIFSTEFKKILKEMHPVYCLMQSHLPF